MMRGAISMIPTPSQTTDICSLFCSDFPLSCRIFTAGMLLVGYFIPTELLAYSSNDHCELQRTSFYKCLWISAPFHFHHESYWSASLQTYMSNTFQHIMPCTPVPSYWTLLKYFYLFSSSTSGPVCFWFRGKLYPFSLHSSDLFPLSMTLSYFSCLCFSQNYIPSFSTSFNTSLADCEDICSANDCNRNVSLSWTLFYKVLRRDSRPTNPDLQCYAHSAEALPGMRHLCPCPCVELG